MPGTIDARLAELGIDLPQGPAPVANYVPFVVTGNLVFISGQVPLIDGKPQYFGHLGDPHGVDEGYEAARFCGLNVIAQLRNACGGDLDRVVRVVKLVGFVASTPAFTDAPKVVNGASDLMVEVFGEAGRHARSAVGVSSLPLGVAVEVEAIFEIK
ncbi:MAG: RidA family protein [Rhodospirillales bacterium]|jgi:enamine deaminase RidA (YjgF/YER057c/UK114 family)|nr:RidA family protein [Rhodospirillales bacterium]